MKGLGTIGRVVAIGAIAVGSYIAGTYVGR